MTKVTENLQLVRQRIVRAAAAAGRDPEQIMLLAVSKKHSPAAIREAFAAGQRHFGENYVQEGIEKMGALSDLDITWHFIGALQSNKTTAVAENFDWVHSLSRLKIARRLSTRRPAGRPPLQVCIQVCIGDEQGKSGVAEADLGTLADEIATLPGLELRGLMCLPPWSADEMVQRQNFRRLRNCHEALVASGHELDILSMGMTGDLEAAVAEGSTCLRIGTAIFGPRT